MDIGIFIQSILTVISALIGASIVFMIKLNHKKLCTLISLSAGGLFGASIFTLIPESLDSLNTIEVILGILSGYFLFWLLTKYYSHVCPACSASHFDARTTKKFSDIVRTLLIALSIHSFLDGIAVSTNAKLHDIYQSTVFIAVFAHKLPEGLALASLMISSNYSRKKIIVYVAAVELITILGAIVGNFVLNYYVSEKLVGIIMSHIAGGFIFLASHAVLGEMFEHHKKLVISSFSIGLILIFVISKFIV